MLFHSQEFLLLFFPVVLAASFAAAGRPRLRLAFLILASLVFYAYWDPRLLPLLVGSVVVNWLFARYFLKLTPGRWFIATGIALNLGLLAVFKYADFLAATFAVLGGVRHDPWNIVLPLGISFFTFQQISYLADVKRARAPLYRFDEYALYVTFFPQLIAGPIVRHNELIGQFAESPLRAGVSERLGRGFVLFVIGLLKKVVVADGLARIADPAFGHAAAGVAPGLLESWAATFAFTFEIYFDFSAYSDMAIGLALMFGYHLPFNFEAPLAARSIRDFWRRWHMTLTRFLTDYVYVSVGNSRALARLAQNAREGVATMVTMLLCGLWHGAAWTFVLWGGMHGAAMVVNQSWRRAGLAMHPGVGWLLTFMLFATSLVLFRAADFAAATQMYLAMFGVDGWSVALSGIARNDLLLFPVAAALALVGPTSQALALERMRPDRWIALAVAAAFVFVVLQVSTQDAASFIYFQF